jgi:deoxyribodipyrimidine photo-lyase
VTLALHWFRTDLRVYDNLALAAAQHDGPVAAIYIATPRQWQAHNDAAIKQDYWRRNLQCLEAALLQLGISLHYFEVAAYSDIPALLASICNTWQVTACIAIANIHLMNAIATQRLQCCAVRSVFK